MSGARRRAAVLLAGIGAGVVAGVVAAPSASAHPLGNATVNHYDGLRLTPEGVTDTAVEDVAEIPTLQRTPLIDADGDGRLSTGERAAYARRQCAALASAVRIDVGRARLALRVVSADYSERPGAIGLSVGRLECRLTARADLSGSVAVAIDDEWDGAGIGWHELTAVGSGVSLRDSPVPATSISDELRHYPNDLLSSPLDQRSATLDVVPGDGATTYRGGPAVPTANAATRLLDRLSTVFDGLVGRHHLTLGTGLLAVLLSLALGAGHAFLPGHGKTIMAAYLVGKRGRFRDVVAVGATVTLTHTAGVLAIGLLLSVTASLAPTAVEQGLAVLSGLIVAAVGLWLLVTAVRHRAARPSAPADLAVLASAVPAAHALDHHTHDHQHHTHPHGEAGEPFSRTGLLGLGVAGGLVPSPSALLVLLGAVALGRTLFGVVLVLGYGVGMAVALTASGLLLLRLRGRLDRLAGSARIRRISWLVNALPVLTASLVLVVGLGLVLQALEGSV